MRILTSVVTVLALGAVGVTPTNAATKASPGEMSDVETTALIAKVKTTWRAQDGETAPEIFGKVSKVAHFIPRGWFAGQSDDGSKEVSMSWVKHPKDKDGDQFSMSWSINTDGSLTLGTPYAKVMELGWQAFALSTIQNEVTDGDTRTNKAFLRDVRNLDFVDTAQGKLGELLAKGNCTLGDPVGVDYSPQWGRDKPEKGDFWRVQLSVDCRIDGPRYFTHDGMILFLKHGTGPWRPYSFFAHRIATSPPGSWFAQADATESALMDRVAQTAAQQGWDEDNRDAMMKVIELRNDGTMIHW